MKDTFDRYSHKIKVDWPFNRKSDVDDSVIFDWLDELENQGPGLFNTVIELNNIALYFTREDDAIAFRLKFGI